MTLGGRINSARESSGLTTNQLAERVGVLPVTLKNWESDRAEPRANKLLTLAGVLGVPLTWLAQGGGGAASREEGVMAPEETQALKLRLASILALHDQQSRLIQDLKADIDRLQARIDGWDADPGGLDG